jgi:hypothetical protein
MNEDRNILESDLHEARMYLGETYMNDVNANIHSYGLRRTMLFTDISMTRQNNAISSNPSIDSPGGFVSYSVGSSLLSTMK